MRSAAVVALLAVVAPARAASDQDIDPAQPVRWFVQAGAAEGVRMVTVGLTRAWDWSPHWLGRRVTGYWEVSMGRWSTEMDQQKSNAWITQIGVTPVLRWYPGSEDARWFTELGIGANALLPIYRSREKRFSTAFNFGDHLAVGWRFGERREHELVLRIQHFSNAGIKHPNPGEDFVQLRYSAAF